MYFFPRFVVCARVCVCVFALLYFYIFWFQVMRYVLGLGVVVMAVIRKEVVGDSDD